MAKKVSNFSSIYSISIFVSHRIDLDSAKLSNPLYHNINCGAIFDKKKLSKLAGDDIGNNISSFRSQYGELTVQYWAWKNCTADYYGLCHYRRYLSFSPKHFPTNEKNQINSLLLCPYTARKFGLTNEARMRSVIEQYDVVTSESANVEGELGSHGTIRDLWKKSDGKFIDYTDIDVLLQAIESIRPDIISYAISYLNGTQHRGYNCYIMRKELFFDMCEFEFSVLKEFEKHTQTDFSKGKMQRTPGYMGEILYGIYIHCLEEQKKYKIKTLQLILFEETMTATSTIHAIVLYLSSISRLIMRSIPDRIMPLGTKRGKVARDIFHSIVGYVFPSGSARIKKGKRLYYRLRGWSYNE